ncbi:DNA glycosylase [Roridomyces roridus]|uniref:DNA glycosylase n=1 Tax=Roridomyces roridus TaxID=1738132 RepID=A0AAD7FLF7_9AGAR|nr:DNA glycosylase [Roridomyces roridus]
MPTTPQKTRKTVVKSPYFERCPKNGKPALESPYFHPETEESNTTLLIQCLTQLKPTLIQAYPESVSSDPWKLLIAVTLLNKTSGKLAIPIFHTLLQAYPTPLLLSQAEEFDLITTLRPLGTQNIRAKRLISLSRVYLQDPPSRRDARPSRAAGPPISPRKRAKYPHTPISHLPGAGAYALDSYRIFCSDEWKDVLPSDKELIKYLKWKWAVDENKEWTPGEGVLGPASAEYITELIEQLTPQESPSPIPSKGG